MPSLRSTERDRSTHPAGMPGVRIRKVELRPKKGELETKFAGTLTSENKSIMLAHYIHANGRFSEESQDRATEGTETHSKTR